jgi:hypothetical protein
MNNFKSIRVISEADADEYILDDDDSEDELAPRADGEAEFVDLHTAVSIAHPVAGDNQFKSDAEADEYILDAEGEDKPVKQGTSGDTKFAQFRDKLGKTPARKGDKSQGDMKAETVKEEVELGEAEDHRKDYETFAKMYAKLNKAKDDAIAGMRKFDKFSGPMGLTPDKVKFSPEYRKAKANYEKASNLTKRFLKGVPKDFMRKYSQPRRLKREEVELDEAVKAGMMKLEDGKSVKVSPDEAKMFNDVMKELNPENRKRMEMEMMKDQKSYKSMLTFAKRTV